MALPDNVHSRLVALLKVMLPLIALGILSTLFLLARGRDPDRNIPYSRIDAETVAGEQRLSAPAYAGLTSSGAAVAIAADVARPTGRNAVEADGLRARIDLPESGHATLVAARGTLDTGAGLAGFAGGVVLESSTGWRVTSEAFEASLDTGTVRSGGSIRASGPAGVIEAGQMTLSQRPGGDYLLVFDGGVRLVHDPVGGR